MTEFILWAVLGITLGLHLLSAALAAARYIAPPRPAPRILPKVALIRPVCGLDPFDAETLGSSFALDYPDFEIIFCAPEDSDPACALVRELIARNPGLPARLLTGLDPITANPKLNNLAKALPASDAQWLAMADSNLLLPPDYLQRLLAEWRPGTGLVSAPPAGARPGNLWGAVECAFLNSNQARWQLAADAVGFGFAQGKSLFWRRDVLEAGGGLAALGHNMAEDVAATKLVRDQGLRVRLAQRLFVQPIGARPARAVWDRQLRWSKVRRDGFPALFVAEIAQGPLVPALAALGLMAAGVMPGWALAGLALLWYGAEWALARIAGWPCGARDLLAFVLRDALLPAIWVRTWRGTEFTWRGTHLARVPHPGE